MNIGVQTGEIWGDIKEFEGLYQVSTWGRVRSIRTGKLLTKWYDKKGYCYVTISKQGKKVNKIVHRIVAETFIPNTENKPTVDHIDRDKDNNYVCNLRWATYEEQRDNSNSGRPKTPIVATINGINYSFSSQAECAKVLSLDKGQIGDCIRGRQKTHKGYTFRYLESSDTINE